MKRLAAFAFVLGAPLVLLGEMPCKNGCSPKASPLFTPIAVKSCETSPPDIASACRGIKVLAPTNAELSGYELFSELIFFWPRMQSGLAKATVAKTGNEPTVVLEAEAEPDRPRLVAVYVRVRKALKNAATGDASLTEAVLDCVPKEAGTVLNVDALTQTQDYFAFRALNLIDSQACFWARSTDTASFKESRSKREAIHYVLDGAPAFDQATTDDVYLEIYAAVHGELVGYRQKLDVPARFLANADDSAQGLEVHPAPPAGKLGIREVFASDPRTVAAPSAISAAHPLIIVAVLPAPLDKIATFTNAFRLRAAGADKGLPTTVFAEGLSGRFVLASSTDPHDQTEFVIDPAVTMRGAPVAADAPAPVISASDIKVVIQDFTP